MKKIITLAILMGLSSVAQASDFTVNFQPDAPTLASITSSAVTASSPIGTISMYGGGTIPTGWKLTDGASLLITDYPALFAAIGVTYGSVDSNHFNLPNTQGVFVRSAGAQTLNSKGFSSTLGVASKDSTAKNGLYDAGHTHTFKSSANTSGGGYVRNTNVYDTGSTAVDTGYANIVSSDVETKPASLTVNYMIKVN